MESRKTTTTDYQTRFAPLESFGGDDELTRQRLDALLALNAETAREKSLYASEKEKIEAGLMKNPLTTEQAFSHLGLLLGFFSPSAFVLRLFMENQNFRREDAWLLGVLMMVNLVSAIVGYFSGRSIGRIVRNLENDSWMKMLLLLPFVGLLWGALSGGAGGALVFVFGAIFGGLIGAAAGSFALPVFAIFHRLLKKGDQIERKHFLPLAFGVTFVISAFMLGV
jgi:hypothetical protein